MHMTRFIHAAHDAVRQRVRRLSPDQRGSLWRLIGMHQTHFYTWLRGDDQAISTAFIDQIMGLEDWEFIPPSTTRRMPQPENSQKES